MKKLFLIVFCFLGLSTQAKDFWTPMRNTPIGAFDRRIMPDHFQLYGCAIEALKNQMIQAPDYDAYQLKEAYHVISLPMPDGSLQRFGFFNDPQMEKELADQFPEIQTFTAFGIDDPYAYAKLDYTLFGFHGMIITLEDRVFIDPYAFGNDRLYMSYYASDNHPEEFWSCTVNDQENKLKKNFENNLESKSMLYNSCGRKNFRLALACTGEYAAFFGGTTAGALSGMTTSMARCNGVYEKDLAYHLNMVANTTSLIYLNSGTDPYTNNNGGTMLGENQTTCDGVIGNSNYDIGHVFSTGGGGVAYLGSICTNSIKAGGVTGSSSPTGDNYDIDYVVHEMGHQFGADHTQNNNCNRNNATAMEPGSGVTIMGYAGICAPDIAAHSIDIYHVISIEEIEAENPTCHTSPVYSNNAPVISTAPLAYSIPASTPFYLTASATDADGDALTYCWETYDNGVATMPPTGTGTTCPNFRDFLPTASPTRYFPNMASLIAGTATTWEVLPTVARLMKFKVTVRDNHAGGGCLDQVAANINSIVTSAPFTVTAPVGTSTSWSGNSTQTVTWNVAGTTAAPISCANVDILMSTDGGVTFPTVLANDVPNDGSQSVTAPNISATDAIIMVVCSSNIFFNISGPVDITPVLACPSIVDGSMTQTAPGPDPYQCESATMTVCVDVDISGDPDALVEFSYDNGANWTTGTYNATNSQFCFSYTVDVATNNCDGQLYTILARFVSSTIDVTCDVDLETATDFVTVYPVLDPVPTPTQATACDPISITIPTCAEGGPLEVYYNVDYTNPLLTDLVNVLGSSYTPNHGEAGTITFSIVNNAAIDGTTCYIIEGTPFNFDCTCFTISSASTSTTSICPNEVVSSISVSTNETAVDGIEFVYFNAAQSGNSMYTGGVSIGTSTADAGGIATLNNFNLPATPGDYYIYGILVNDNPACQPYTESIITVHPIPTIASLLATNPTTCGGTDGTISLNGLNPSETYIVNYDFNTVPAISQTLTADASGMLIITGLIEGDYTNINVTQYNCTSLPQSTTLVDPTTPVITTTSTNPTTCGGTDGTITVEGLVNGQSYTLSYTVASGTVTSSIVASGTTYTITGLNAGLYNNITVTTAGCTSNIETETLTNPTAPTFTVSVLDATTCVPPNGSITLIGLNISDNYTLSYQSPTGNILTNITTDASGEYIISGLAGGTYSNIILIQNGCSSAAAGPFTLTGPSIPTYTILSSSDPSICGLNDGVIALSGMTANTTYTLTYVLDGTPASTTITTDASGNNNWSNLIAGTYSNIIITNASACSSAPQTATLTNPAAITISATASNTSTCNGTDGQITINGLIAGQTYTYSYDYNTATVTNTFTATSTSQSITGLSAGVYTNIEVSSLGCTSNAVSTTITDPALPTFSTSFTNPSICGSNDGEIVLSGMTANTTYTLTYTVDGTPASTSITTDASGNYAWSNLVAGTYSNIIITNASACSSAPQAATLTNPAAITISASASNTSTCNGTDGQITINGLIAGQTYTYSYDYNTATVTNTFTATSTSQSITGLSAGAYTNIEVSSLGCTSNAVSTAIVDPSLPTFSISSTNVSVCAGTDGSILLSGLDATTTYTLDYTFNSSNVSTTMTSDAAGSITLASLSAGDYSNITVTTNSCISASQSVSLTEPSSIALSENSSDISCNGANDGTATISASGGSCGIYDYVWSHDATLNSNSATNLAPGNYTVVVSDNCGAPTSCSSTISFTIAEPSVVSAPSTTSAVTLCLNGSATPLSATGTGTINWYDGSNTLLTAAPTPSTSTLGITNYYVSQTIAGCESVLVPVIVYIVDCSVFPIGLTIIDPCECTGGSMVASIQATGGTAPYSVVATTALNPATGMTYTLAELNALIDPITGALLMPITENTSYSVTIDDSDPLTTAATYSDLTGCTRPTFELLTASNYCISSTQSQVPIIFTSSSSSIFNVTASAGVYNSTDNTLTLNNSVVSIVSATDENNCVSDDVTIGPYDCTVTPLTLSSLLASSDCKETVLSWNTYQEQDIIGFEIYRSYDGIHFEKIDMVPSQGSSLSMQSYTYTDSKSMSQDVYYKIIVLDINGSSTVSNIVYTQRNCDQVVVSNIAPNPFTDELLLTLLISQETKLNIEIVELNGRILSSSNYTLQAGLQRLPIATEQLAPAIYFIKISDDQNVYGIQKMIKEK